MMIFFSSMALIIIQMVMVLLGWDPSWNTPKMMMGAIVVAALSINFWAFSGLREAVGVLDRVRASRREMEAKLSAEREAERAIMRRAGFTVD